MKTKRTSMEAMYIKVRRVELGMSQVELGRKIGKPSKQYISNLENGLYGVPPNIIGKLAKALRVPPLKLIKLRVAEYEKELRAKIFKKGKAR